MTVLKVENEFLKSDFDKLFVLPSTGGHVVKVRFGTRSPLVDNVKEARLIFGAALPFFKAILSHYLVDAIVRVYLLKDPIKGQILVEVQEHFFRVIVHLDQRLA